MKIQKYKWEVWSEIVTFITRKESRDFTRAYKILFPETHTKIKIVKYKLDS